MKTIYLVTGNKNKLKEWQRLLPPGFNIDNVDVDLDEIQSMDLQEIAIDKAKRAYEVVGKPVIVEDISASLDKLNGLPGPFIKYFEERLGGSALFKLSDGVDDKALVTCTIAYYDGKNAQIFTGEVVGTVTESRGDNGFGFDKCFMPEGQTKTYGQMAPEEKDKVSHRSKGIKAFAAGFSSAVT